MRNVRPTSAVGGLLAAPAVAVVVLVVALDVVAEAVAAEAVGFGLAEAASSTIADSSSSGVDAVVAGAGRNLSFKRLLSRAYYSKVKEKQEGTIDSVNTKRAE